LRTGAFSILIDRFLRRYFRPQFSVPASERQVSQTPPTFGATDRSIGIIDTKQRFTSHSPYPDRRVARRNFFFAAALTADRNNVDINDNNHNSPQAISVERAEESKRAQLRAG
jgi:hypothetical protein